MLIKDLKLKIRDLVDGYKEDEATSRVVAWGGKLDVRPEYQREYVYDNAQRDAVINTVLHGFPLNIMYFVDRKDGSYEVLDGQQRIISICRFYANSAISVKLPAPTGGFNYVNFPNLFADQREDFLNYELQVYICEGTEKEKIEWFEVINIAGEKLEKQEIRNAVLHSPWLTDAKSIFSRRNGAANKRYGKYFSGNVIRQKYLETAFRWAADAEGIKSKDIEETIRKYMISHSEDKNADKLWKYIEDVFAWVKKVFGEYDSFMSGLEWGIFYNKHKDDVLDPEHIRERVKELMANGAIGKRSGIYQYILEGETVEAERYLSLRQFDDDIKRMVFEQQGRVCAICGKPFNYEQMHGDHIIPWIKGGRTEASNCQMLCAQCNLKKGSR